MGILDVLYGSKKLDEILALQKETIATLDDIEDDVNDIYEMLCEEPPPPPPPVVEHPDILWEPYLDELNAGVEIVDGARYQLVAMWHTLNGQWDGVPDYAREYIKVNGGGGDTHAFAIVYNKDGTPLVGKSVLLTWPGGDAGGMTWNDGSVSFFTPGKYYPDQGQTGPYCVEVLNGDKYLGAGLPYGQHVSIFGVWRERDDYKPSAQEKYMAGVHSVQPVVSSNGETLSGGETPFVMIVGQKVEG